MSMTPIDYQTVLFSIHAIARLLVGMENLEAARAAASTASAIAPLIDPTLYREKGEALAEDTTVMSILAEARDKLVKAGVKGFTKNG